MALVSHGTSACASFTFAPPTTNKIGAMGAVGAMVPAYFSMTVPKTFRSQERKVAMKDFIPQGER